MTENQSRILRLVMVGILLFSMFVVTREGAIYVSNMEGGAENAGTESGRKCVVIDPGHGGKDPGKVGVNGALEMDVNLQIAKKLQKFLEAEDVQVILTREGEKGLYDENASNKKVQDMKRRIEVIAKADPELVISIHQNSYHEEYVKGSQVFYYTGGEQSRQLAETIQERLKILDPENKREAKGNDSYYLLKKTPKPIVIVECGFLSNTGEAEKLITPFYQEKLAWHIHMGIMQYLNERQRG